MECKHDTRCPNCGRFVPHDADGFYARVPPYEEWCETACYCSAACANELRRKYLREK